MIPGVVAVPPKAIQVHSLAMIGLDVAGELIKRPEMVMRVDSRDVVQALFYAAVGLSFTGRPLRRVEGHGAEKQQATDKQWLWKRHGMTSRTPAQGSVARVDSPKAFFNWTVRASP